MASNNPFRSRRKPGNGESPTSPLSTTPSTSSDLPGPSSNPPLATHESSAPPAAADLQYDSETLTQELPPDYSATPQQGEVTIEEGPRVRHRRETPENDYVVVQAPLPPLSPGSHYAPPLPYPYAPHPAFAAPPPQETTFEDTMFRLQHRLSQEGSIGRMLAGVIGTVNRPQPEPHIPMPVPCPVPPHHFRSRSHDPYSPWVRPSYYVVNPLLRDSEMLIPPGATPVPPGDPRLGGRLCLECGGNGLRISFLGDFDSCPQCDGVGRRWR